MEIAVTFELRRDSLEDDFKVCKQISFTSETSSFLIIFKNSIIFGFILDISFLQ